MVADAEQVANVADDLCVGLGPGRSVLAQEAVPPDPLGVVGRRLLGDRERPGGD